MAALDSDGFDNYTTITDRWSATGSDCTIRLNTGQSRTGIGCLQINSAAFGPAKDFNHMTDLLCCVAWFSDRAGACFRFIQTDNFGPNVTVNVPRQAPPKVQVNVPEQPAPVVNITNPPMKKTVHRDGSGKITQITEEPEKPRDSNG